MHPAEIQIAAFLQQAVSGNASMADEVIEQIASDVKDALHKQFNSGPRDDFRMRMSNIGKPKCQLWFEKNDPESKEPQTPHFMINMILGDLVEAVFKGILRAADVPFEDNASVELTLPGGQKIKGEYDMVMNGRVDDVKSASDWAYKNKFQDLDSVERLDKFGYIAQLVGYATAAQKDVGGWWVINKNNGKFTYVDASSVQPQQVLQEVQDKVDYIEGDEPFERCFEPVPETYRRTPSGNMVLNSACKFCDFRRKCWPSLRTLPSKVSQAKDLPYVDYISLKEDEDASKA